MSEPGTFAKPVAGWRAFDEETILRRLETDPANLEFDGDKFVEKNVDILTSRTGGWIGTRFNMHLISEDLLSDFYVLGSDCIYRCWPQRPGMFRKPDVSVIRAARVEGRPRVVTVPPDLAVEVLSPNDVADDVTRKIELYREAGFGPVWVVNLPNRSIDVHAPDGSVTRHRGDDTITAGDALPGFEAKVSDLFPPA